MARFKRVYTPKLEKFWHYKDDWIFLAHSVYMFIYYAQILLYDICLDFLAFKILEL